MSLRLDWPNTWLESDLPCDSVYALEYATFYIVRSLIQSVEEIIRTDVVESPNESDPAIGMLPPVHLLVAVELLTLQLPKLAFIGVEKLNHVNLLAVFESGLQWLMIFQFDDFKCVVL